MSYFHQYGRVPKWFDAFGELGTPIRVPHWSKFGILEEETNIRLVGVPDEILRHPKRGLWIGDYKTAKFTGCQDALFPMYELQLNCYAIIAARLGMGSVYGLGILYYEPRVTAIDDSDRDKLIKDDHFYMQFVPKLKHVNLETSIVFPLLRKVREIYDSPESPRSRPDCTDCMLLETLIKSERNSLTTGERRVSFSLRSRSERQLLALSAAQTDSGFA